MTNAKRISVLIPVYCNAKSLRTLASRLEAALCPKWSDFEVLLVNDGSSDNSWTVIEEIAEGDSRFKGICLSRNYGQHAAIAAALEHATNDILVLMDADLQDPPEDIPRLLEVITENNVDIVYTVKVGGRGTGANRLGSKIFHWAFDKIAKSSTPKNIGTFRAFNKKVANSLKRYREYGVIYGPLMHQMGFKTTSVDVQRDEREGGRSGYTFLKRFRLASSTLFAYSSIPYQIMIFLGGIVASLSTLYMLMIVVQRLFFDVALPAGFALLAATQMLTLGLVIGSIGVLGNYVYLVYREVLQRPRYLIQTTLNLGELDE